MGWSLKVWRLVVEGRLVAEGVAAGRGRIGWLLQSELVAEGVAAGRWGMAAGR